jgi:hypothetical protein
MVSHDGLLDREKLTFGRFLYSYELNISADFFDIHEVII